MAMPKPNKGENKQDFLKRCTGELVDREGRESDQAFAMCNAFWDDSKSQRSALSLTAPLSLAPAQDGEPAKGFLITAYTGAVIDRGWGKLVIATDGIKVNAKMPVLREHERSRVVGYSTKAWKENGNLFLQGDFSAKSVDGQEVKDLSEEGFPWQASIGVWPKKVKVLDSDKEIELVNGQEVAGPADIWLESYVREVSFCALGADDETAAISLADHDKKVRVSIERSGPKLQEADMPITLQQLEAEAPELLKEIRGSARSEGLAAGQVEGAAIERARVVEILEADGDRAVTLEAVKAGTSAGDAFKQFFRAEKDGRDRALEEMRKNAPPSMGQKPPAEGQDFEAKVKEYQAAGKTQGQAIKLAAKEFPELHQAYIDRHNPAEK
jgi:uncharacterized protein YoaH (UPF0181 family)